MDPFQSDENVPSFRFLVDLSAPSCARRAIARICNNFIFSFRRICTNIVLSVALRNQSTYCGIVIIVPWPVNCISGESCIHVARILYIYLQLGKFFIVIRFHLIRALYKRSEAQSYQIGRLIGKQTKGFACAPAILMIKVFCCCCYAARPKVSLFHDFFPGTLLFPPSLSQHRYAERKLNRSLNAIKCDSSAATSPPLSTSVNS